MCREAHVRAAETDWSKGRRRAAARPHRVKVRDGAVAKPLINAVIGVDAMKELRVGPRSG
jgi:hypothetical protein